MSRDLRRLGDIEVAYAERADFKLPDPGPSDQKPSDNHPANGDGADRKGANGKRPERHCPDGESRKSFSGMPTRTPYPLLDGRPPMHFGADRSMTIMDCFHLLLIDR
jgi:hypothetical protein